MPHGTPTIIPAANTSDIALFRDATEMLFAVAEHRRAVDPTAPWVPGRYFVKDADEAHRIALAGPSPMVGMSLDDLIDCARGSDPQASQLAAFAAVHRGFLQLMAAPGITDIASLTGRRIAVDTDTGYASALFAMLERQGLERGRDFTLVYAGATNLRYEKLLRGEFEATLLGAPYTRLAQRRGHPSLATVIGTLGGYQAIVLLAHRPWLAANAALARRVAACLQGTLAWAAQPAHRPTLEAFMGAIHPDLDAATVGELAQDLFGPAGEFLPGGQMRAGDVTVVIDLFNGSRGAAVTPAMVEGMTAYALPAAL